MTDPANDKDPRTRTFAELRKTGLLWLINTSLLHPRGFAMAVVLNDQGDVTGWKLLGDGTEPWIFNAECDEQFAAVEELLRPAGHLVPTPLPAGWAGLTADIHEFEAPQEAVHIDGTGLLPGACGQTRDGRTCTRAAGHPRTLHIAHDATGQHQGEWDAN